MTAVCNIPTTESKVTHRVLIGHRAKNDGFVVLGIGKNPHDAIRDAHGAAMDGVVQVEVAGCTREVATYLKAHSSAGSYALHTDVALPEGLHHLITAK